MGGEAKEYDIPPDNLAIIIRTTGKSLKDVKDSVDKDLAGIDARLKKYDNTKDAYTMITAEDIVKPVTEDHCKNYRGYQAKEEVFAGENKKRAQNKLEVPYLPNEKKAAELQRALKALSQPNTTTSVKSNQNKSLIYVEAKIRNAIPRKSEQFVEAQVKYYDQAKTNATNLLAAIIENEKKIQQEEQQKKEQQKNEEQQQAETQQKQATEANILLSAQEQEYNTFFEDHKNTIVEDAVSEAPPGPDCLSAIPMSLDRYTENSLKELASIFNTGGAENANIAKSMQNSVIARMIKQNGKQSYTTTPTSGNPPNLIEKFYIRNKHLDTQTSHELVWETVHRELYFCGMELMRLQIDKKENEAKKETQLAMPNMTGNNSNTWIFDTDVTTYSNYFKQLEEIKQEGKHEEFFTKYEQKKSEANKVLDEYLEKQYGEATTFTMKKQQAKLLWKDQTEYQEYLKATLEKKSGASRTETCKEFAIVSSYSLEAAKKAAFELLAFINEGKELPNTKTDKAWFNDGMRAFMMLQSFASKMKGYDPLSEIKDNTLKQKYTRIQTMQKEYKPKKDALDKMLTQSSGVSKVYDKKSFPSGVYENIVSKLSKETDATMKPLVLGRQDILDSQGTDAMQRVQHYLGILEKNGSTKKSNNFFQLLHMTSSTGETYMKSFRPNQYANEQQRITAEKALQKSYTGRQGWLLKSPLASLRNNIGGKVLQAGASIGLAITGVYRNEDEMIHNMYMYENLKDNVMIDMPVGVQQGWFDGESKNELSIANKVNNTVSAIANMYTMIGIGGGMRGLLTKLGLKATAVTAGASVISGSLLSYGDYYIEGMKHDMNSTQSMTYALCQSGLQGGLELISPWEVDPKLAVNINLLKLLMRGDTYATLGKKIVAENIQELGQTAAELGVNKAINSLDTYGQTAYTMIANSIKSDQNLIPLDASFTMKELGNILVSTTIAVMGTHQARENTNGTAKTHEATFKGFVTDTFKKKRISLSLMGVLYFTPLVNNLTGLIPSSMATNLVTNIHPNQLTPEKYDSIMGQLGEVTIPQEESTNIDASVTEIEKDFSDDAPPDIIGDVGNILASQKEQKIVNSQLSPEEKAKAFKGEFPTSTANNTDLANRIDEAHHIGEGEVGLDGQEGSAGLYNYTPGQLRRKMICLVKTHGLPIEQASWLLRNGYCGEALSSEQEVIMENIVKNITRLYNYGNDKLIVLSNGNQYIIDVRGDVKPLFPSVSTRELELHRGSTLVYFMKYKKQLQQIQHKLNLVSELIITSPDGKPLTIDGILQVQGLVGKTLLIQSSKSGKPQRFVVQELSSQPIGTGGYGSVYIVKGLFGTKTISVAIKVLSPYQRGSNPFGSAAEKQHLLKTLGFPTFTTYRPVANNSNLLVMTSLSTPSQYCISVNNSSSDKSELCDLIKNQTLTIPDEAVVTIKETINEIFAKLDAELIEVNNDAFFLTIDKQTGALDVMLGDFDRVVMNNRNLINQNTEQARRKKESVKKINLEQKDLLIKQLEAIIRPNSTQKTDIENPIYPDEDFQLGFDERGPGWNLHRRHRKEVSDNLALSDDVPAEVGVRKDKMKEVMGASVGEESKDALLDILRTVHMTAEGSAYEGGIIPASEAAGYPVKNRSPEALAMKIRQGYELYEAAISQGKLKTPGGKPLSREAFSLILKTCMRKGLCARIYKDIGERKYTLEGVNSNNLEFIGNGIDSDTYAEYRNSGDTVPYRIIKDYRNAKVENSFNGLERNISFSKQDLDLYYNEFLPALDTFLNERTDGKIRAYNQGYTDIPQSTGVGRVVSVVPVPGPAPEENFMAEQKMDQVHALINEFIGKVVPPTSLMTLDNIKRLLFVGPANVSVLPDGTWCITDVTDIKKAVTEYKIYQQKQYEAQQNEIQQMLGIKAYNRLGNTDTERQQTLLKIWQFVPASQRIAQHFLELIQDIVLLSTDTKKILANLILSITIADGVVGNTVHTDANNINNVVSIINAPDTIGNKVSVLKSLGISPEHISMLYEFGLLGTDTIQEYNMVDIEDFQLGDIDGSELSAEEKHRKEVSENLALSDDNDAQVATRNQKMQEVIGETVGASSQDALLDILRTVHATAQGAAYDGGVIPASEAAGYPVKNRSPEALSMKINKGYELYEAAISQGKLKTSDGKPLSKEAFSQILKTCMRKGLCALVLRDYQERILTAVDPTIQAWCDGKLDTKDTRHPDIKHNTILLDVATGGGKTVMVANMIEKIWKQTPPIKVLATTDRIGLVEQNRKAFFNGVMNEEGKRKEPLLSVKLRNKTTVHTYHSQSDDVPSDFRDDATNAGKPSHCYNVTLQTLADPRVEGALGDLDIIFLDEADIVGETSKYYETLKKYYKPNKQGKYPLIIAVTATPDNQTKKIFGEPSGSYTLGEYLAGKAAPKVNYNMVAPHSMDREVMQGIQNDITETRNTRDPKKKKKALQAVKEKVNTFFAKFENNRGEYLKRALGDLCGARNSNNGKINPEQKTMIFVKDIDEANKVTQALNTFYAPNTAVAVARHSENPDSVDRTMQNLRWGPTKIVVCVGQLDRGIDVPSLDNVVFLSGSDSPKRFIQRLGRGLRGEKVNVYDYVGGFVNIGWLNDIYREYRTHKERNAQENAENNQNQREEKQSFEWSIDGQAVTSNQTGISLGGLIRQTMVLEEEIEKPTRENVINLTETEAAINSVKSKYPDVFAFEQMSGAWPNQRFGNIGVSKLGTLLGIEGINILQAEGKNRVREIVYGVNAEKLKELTSAKLKTLFPDVFSFENMRPARQKQDFKSIHIVGIETLGKLLGIQGVDMPSIEGKNRVREIVYGVNTEKLKQLTIAKFRERFPSGGEFDRNSGTRDEFILQGIGGPSKIGILLGIQGVKMTKKAGKAAIRKVVYEENHE